MKRPALALGSGPRGVHDARRWIVEWCDALARPELVECAELGVSELVTNALLHGVPPIEVSIGGTEEHPRIEVRDGSPDVPVLPPEVSPLLADEEEALETYGRGLNLVARSSQAWGADVDDAGKVVWFEPAETVAEDHGPSGVVTGAERPRAPERGSDDRTDFLLLGVPVRLYLAFQRHYRELRREVRLLALAHESTYPLAKDLSDLFGTLERPLREGLGHDRLRQAGAHLQHTTDLRVTMNRDAAAQLDRFLELLELADAFCREERLLSLARTAEQIDFQRWFLGELVRQAAGADPTRWSEEAATPLRRSGVS